MREFERKKKIKRFLYSRVVIFGLCILLLFMINAAWSIYTKEKASEQNLVKVQAEASKLSEREAMLKDSVRYLQTDEGIESEIRTKFRGVRGGENVAIILNDVPKPAPTIQRPDSWWVKIQKFFGIL